MPGRLVLVLGDQLARGGAAFDGFDRGRDRVCAAPQSFPDLVDAEPHSETGGQHALRGGRDQTVCAGTDCLADAAWQRRREAGAIT